MPSAAFDLDVVLPKVHRALVPGGHFAGWRHVFRDPSVPVTQFRKRVAAIIGRRGDEPPRPGLGEFSTQACVSQLTGSGHFLATHVEQFQWTIELRADQVRDLFTTFTNWNAAEVDEAAQAAHNLGGRVTEHYITLLIELGRTQRLTPITRPLGRRPKLGRRLQQLFPRCLRH